MLGPIDSYLNDILAPQIARGYLKGHPAIIKVVTDDISKRLRSLLSRWADVEVRNTLLFTGREEAIFYEPESAPLDVRALIVVGIRNSLLEELSTDYSTLLPRGVRLPLTDEDMPIITRAAIEYWRDVQLDCLSIPQSHGDDVFGLLADQYPHAWNALFHLANAKRQSVAYPACIAPAPPVPISLTQRRDDARRTVGLSGISSQIDLQLADYLRAIAAGTIRVFFSDSWKMLTRHPGKLYRIIDIVLANGQNLLTHSYLLTPTASYARVPILRPAHTDREVFSKFSSLKGLVPNHRALIIATRRDLMSSG